MRTWLDYPPLASRSLRSSPCRTVSQVAGVSMYNAEEFELREAEGEKFRNMLEVIEATNCDLGVSTRGAVGVRKNGPG